MRAFAKIPTCVWEAISIIATPAMLVACALLHIEQTALLSFAVVMLSLVIFFAGYEASAPRLRDIMPTVVLAALAAAGRILFAPIPDFKPVSAIAIIAGVAFGRKSGFMVGSLAALASNFFFGQGAWTPWQMYAWGLVGYGAGLLAELRIPKRPQANTNKEKDNDKAKETEKNVQATRAIDAHPIVIYLYGFLSCLGYGFILNAWSILSFYHAQASGLAGVLAVYAAALPFDVFHGVATVIFLLALFRPWTRKLRRTKAKFGLR